MIKRIYPKCWVAAVPKFWNEEIPSDYPTDTGSEFSLNFDSKEDRLAVQEMESKLGTEESIITEDMLPNQYSMVGNYLGTYNVTGTPGEKVLLSPKAVSDKAIGALAFHYVVPTSAEEGTEDSGEETVDTQAEGETEESTTEEPTTASWVRIEDAEIVDGYVYGTVESFSPIAVFEVKRDTFYDNNKTFFNNPMFIANGIPVKVYKSEDGKICVEDGNGKITEITANTTIMGGGVDGSDLESTSISVNGVDLASIYAGSYCVSEDRISTIKNACVKVYDCKLTTGLSGIGYFNRIENLDVTFKNVKASHLGAGECYNSSTKKDANQEFLPDLGLGANCWVKNSKFTVEDSDIYVAYTSGNSGYLYVDHSEMVAKNTKFGYLTAGGSNGGTNETEIEAENCTIDVFQTTNRGFVRSAEGALKNCTVKVCAVCGDPTDPSVDGTVDSVKLDFTRGTINLYAGTNGGAAVDAETANEIVEYVKIGRETNVTYMNNADQILKDVIRLK